jgi:hypothetical protein
LNPAYLAAMKANELLALNIFFSLLILKMLSEDNLVVFETIFNKSINDISLRNKKLSMSGPMPELDFSRGLEYLGYCIKRKFPRGGSYVLFRSSWPY